MTGDKSRGDRKIPGRRNPGKRGYRGGKVLGGTALPAREHAGFGGLRVELALRYSPGHPL
jgi:hypothetical protein